MPLRWISQPPTPASPLPPEEPVIVLAAPGSVRPDNAAARRRVLQALAAGSLAVVAFRPFPAVVARPLASTFTVTNLLPTGAGSLRQAINSANANPGPDTVTFQAGLVGTIPITAELSISDSIQIVGPGPGALAVSGGNLTRVFYLSSTAQFTTTISGLTIRDGSLTKAGGGAGILDNGQPLILDNVAILSNTTDSGGGGVEVTNAAPNQGALTVRNSVIAGNQANAGGGILANRTFNAVLIQNTQITGNVATNVGGGLLLYRTIGDVTIEDANIAGNSAQEGGGVYFYRTAAGNDILRRTTVSGNTAHKGGGIEFYGTSAKTLIENSTISGNHATNGAGGGAYLYRQEPVTIQNSTIVSNTATTNGGGIYVSSGTLPITNTIIAGNSAPTNRDLDGRFTLSHDLVQITGTATISNAGGNLFGLDPQLGPLANNGGPTQTHLPAHNSLVIDAGDPAFAPPPATDQRGDARVVGAHIDIGAVEVNAGAVQFTSSGFSVAENGLTATVTLTRTGGSDGAVSVDYATGGGTAIPGTDYQPASGTLHWANGDTATKSFTVSIIDDILLEGDETVGLTLTNPQGGAALGSPITATLTIIDNDHGVWLPLVMK